MSKRNKKSKRKSKRSKTPATPVPRSAAAMCAAIRQRTGGGIHKDKRTKRQNRQSWRKEYLGDD